MEIVPVDGGKDEVEFPYGADETLPVSVDGAVPLEDAIEIPVGTGFFTEIPVESPVLMEIIWLLPLLAEVVAEPFPLGKLEKDEAREGLSLIEEVDEVVRMLFSDLTVPIEADGPVVAVEVPLPKGAEVLEAVAEDPADGAPDGLVIVEEIGGENIGNENP